MAVDKSMNVLVVDDYKTMVRIVRGLLEQLGFHNIDDATGWPKRLREDSTKGLRPYPVRLEHGADDRVRPLKGRACRARTKSVPFVMVTAEAKTENVVLARQAGVNNYIIKPFNLAVLKQKLASVLGEL